MKKWQLAAALTGLTTLSVSAAIASAPKVKDVLSIKPKQQVLVDIPKSETGLRVKVVREGKISGWVLVDSSGRIYRRFMDTNRDNVVDQWGFYHSGREVYRDIDSNFNGKADNYRWFNMAGSRWAVDQNEDGKVDFFRSISVEEMSIQFLQALRSRDASLMSPLLVSSNDQPGINTVFTPADLKGLRRKAIAGFSALVQKVSHFGEDTKWVRFDGSIPQLIPGPAADGSRDLLVYPSGTVVVQTGERLELLQFRNLIRVGSSWRMTAIPKLVPADGAKVELPSSISTNDPSIPDPPAPTQEPSKSQILISELQKIDELSGAARGSIKDVAQYQSKRAVVLEKLVQASETDEERLEWQKQLVDGLLSILQAREDKQSVQKLEQIERASAGALSSYIAFRVMYAEYTRAIQSRTVNFAKQQEKWLTNLKRFVDDYPKSSDTPEALSQLAVGYEFLGDEKQSRKYYEALRDGFTDTPESARAAGALKRLDLEGQQIELVAHDLANKTVDVAAFKGKMVLVTYWATWCTPCMDEVEDLKKIYDRYRRKGFEIVAINLDDGASAARAYVQKERLPWTVLHEKGGMNGPLASQYGIVSLPAHFLVGKDGRVLSTSVQIGQLPDELEKALK